MKKLLIICLVLAGFSRCKMLHTEGFNTYFWTSAEGEKLYLFIEGENKGLLPYLPAGPDCGNEELKKKTLRVDLPSGSYDIIIKNEQQETLYSEELRIKRRGGSLTIGNSTDYKRHGTRRVFKDSCLIEEFYLYK